MYTQCLSAYIAPLPILHRVNQVPCSVIVTLSSMLPVHCMNKQGTCLHVDKMAVSLTQTRAPHELRSICLSLFVIKTHDFYSPAEVSKNFDSPLWRKTSKIFSPNGSSLRICERGEWLARTLLLRRGRAPCLSCKYMHGGQDKS